MAPINALYNFEEFTILTSWTAGNDWHRDQLCTLKATSGVHSSLFSLGPYDSLRVTSTCCWFSLYLHAHNNGCPRSPKLPLFYVLGLPSYTSNG